MIIEIKDLPHGRKVTRILVDVSFDDSGEPQSVSQSFLNETNSSTSINDSDTSSTNNTSNTEGPEEIALVKRDPALSPGIPSEMLDMEF